MEKNQQQDRATNEKNQPLAMWQERLRRNKLAYESQLALMQERDAIYNGTNEVDNKNGGLGGAKPVSNVFNAVYELIESQVDSTIPMPRVTAAVQEDVPFANEVEDMLRMKLDALPFEEFNDMNERNTYNQGGDFALVEWDNTTQGRNRLGELRVRGLHPLQVIPQHGVMDIEEMDYIFLRMAATRKSIQKKYGVLLCDKMAEQQDGQQGPLPEDVVTLYIAYYKNSQGGIGRFVWAGQTQLEHLEDYEARQVQVCKHCKQIRKPWEKECAACGKQAFEQQQLTSEEVEIRDESGQLHKVQVACYKPGLFPVVLRKNVSKYGCFLGSSDVDMIRPQQDAIKKLTHGSMEKLTKGGSYIILPRGVKTENNDRQLKVLRVDTPAQKDMVGVVNLQPNISYDMAATNDHYEKAKSTLGITSSFQGKPDQSASSGIAKQFAAAQAAGRLESKRRMKNAFYQRLFEVMFRFMLAYSNGPVKFRSVDEKGNEIFTEFNRYDFLKQDEAGEWYWNDEFLFSVDTTGGLAQNREGMWAEAESKFVNGALGNPAMHETRVLYWTLLEQLQFPLAKSVKRCLLEESPETSQLVQNSPLPQQNKEAPQASVSQQTPPLEENPPLSSLVAQLLGGSLTGPEQAALASLPDSVIASLFQQEGGNLHAV